MAEDHITSSSNLKFAFYLEGALCYFIQATLSYGIEEVPRLEVVVPATASLNNNIPLRSKVAFVMKDLDTNSLNVLFEGDVLNVNFSKSPMGSRQLILNCVHYTYSLEATPLDILSIDEHIRDLLTRDHELGIFPGTQSITGSVFDIFSPKVLLDNIKKLSGKDYKFKGTNPNAKQGQFDLYNYSSAVLEFFELSIAKSVVRESYDAKIVSGYKISNELYISNKASLEWDTVFSNLLVLFFTNMVKRIGGKLSYLSLIRQLLGLYLYEHIILPNPKTQYYSLVIKPNLSFHPIPRCNVILPIFNSSYSYFESHEAMPTRLIQYATPPFDLTGDPVLAGQYRLVAPEELQTKIDEYRKKGSHEHNLSEESSLVTEEEKQRGIVPSYNEVPVHMQLAIGALYENKDLMANAYSKSSPRKAAPPSKEAQKALENTKKVEEAVKNLSDIDRNKLRIKFYDYHLKRLISQSTDKVPLGYSRASGSTINRNRRFYINEKTKVVILKSGNTNYFNSFKNTEDSFSFPHYVISTNGKIFQTALRYLGFFPIVKPFKYTVVLNSINYYGPTNTDVLDPLVFTNFNRPSLDEKYFQIIKNGNVKNNPLTATNDISFIDFVYDNHLVFLVESDNDPVLDAIGLLLSFISKLHYSLDDLSLELTSELYNKEYFKKLGNASPIFTVDKNKLSKIEKIKKDYDKKYSRAYSDYVSNYIASTKKIVNYVPVEEVKTIRGTEILPKSIAKSQEITSPESQTTISKTYLRPLANFFFYTNRFSAFNQTISLVFNPYITPGFPAILLDNAKNPIHIVGYVRSVAHTLTPSSAHTSVSMTTMRKINDIYTKNAYDQFLGRTKNGEIKGVQIPFWGNEWLDDYSETIADLLGVTTIDDNYIADPENFTFHNIETAWRHVYRPIQKLGSSTLSAASKDILDIFPRNIQSKRYKVNPQVAYFVRSHTDTCVARVAEDWS